MNNVTLTFSFTSAEDAIQFLTARTGLPSTPPQIAAIDRPDCGVQPNVPAEQVQTLAPVTFNPFAGAAAVPVSPPVAPSTAGAAVPPTAPAAPTSTAAIAPGAPAPTLAPAAPAPAAPASPASPAGIEVDADGLPWDARIHAGGRAKNADGRWRQKRGLNDAAFKSRVEAELRQAMAAPAAPSVSVVPPAVAAPVAAASPVSAIPTPPAAPSDAPTVPLDFTGALMRVGALQMSGKISQAQSDAALQKVGLTTFAQLALRPDLVAEVVRLHDEAAGV